ALSPGRRRARWYHRAVRARGAFGVALDDRSSGGAARISFRLAVARSRAARGGGARYHVAAHRHRRRLGDTFVVGRLGRGRREPPEPVSGARMSAMMGKGWTAAIAVCMLAMPIRDAAAQQETTNGAPRSTRAG